MAPSKKNAMMPPRERLAWVKIHGMQVFWPACVYEAYDPATAHSHDVSALRALKPALDKEDRVVFFFGIQGNNNCNVSSHVGIAPNLRFCVSNDLTVLPWGRPEDFAKLCRRHQSAEESIMRAQQNSVFQRACGHAARFQKEATSDNVRDVFMSLVREMMATTSRVKGVRQQIITTATSTAMPTIPATPTKKTNTNLHNTKPLNNVHANTTAKPKSVVSAAKVKSFGVESQLTEEFQTACWDLMQAQGWSTLVQGDGLKLYTMPGVSFFEFRPNVTVFDALGNACTKFLQSWAANNLQNQQNKENQQNQQHDAALRELVWRMMVAVGWQSVQSANETWFLMPNTPFDRFIPNVTIFQSKQLAVAKFLDSTTYSSINTSAATSEPAPSHSSQSDSGSESGSDVDDETQSVRSEGEVDLSDVDMSGDDETNQRMLSEDDEEDEEEENKNSGDKKRDARVYAKIVKVSVADKKEPPTRNVAARKRVAQPERKTPKPSVNRDQPRPAVVRKKEPPPPRVVIPPFKCSSGKVEKELRARGWYWKHVAAKVAMDGYMFYKPHCREMTDETELIMGEDCFAGRLALDLYLEGTGLYAEIEGKLRRDHERLYIESESEVDEGTQSSEGEVDSSDVEMSGDETDQRMRSEKDQKDEEEHGSSRDKQRDASAASGDELPRQNVAVRKPVGLPAAATTTYNWDQPPSAVVTKKKVAPPPPIPPFKCSPGKMEIELGARGWYWKPVSMRIAMDGYMYYKPHCREMEEEHKEPIIGEDCFAGRPALDLYLKQTGLYAEIERKLRRDHKLSYSRQRSSTSSGHNAMKSTTKPTPKPQQVVDDGAQQRERVRPPQKSKDRDDDDSQVQVNSSKSNSKGVALAVAHRPVVEPSKASGRRRKPAPTQIKRIRPSATTTSTSSRPVKFQDIWRIIAKRGWYYRPGRFGYDYFKPTCTAKENCVDNEDYFQSEEALEEYLKDTGLWEDAATEVRRQWEASEQEDDDDDEEDAFVEIQVTPQKRKASAEGKKHEQEDDRERQTPVAKKLKVKDTNTQQPHQSNQDFHTPPNNKRASEYPQEDEIAITQDLSALCGDDAPLISPENDTSKSRQDDAMGGGATGGGAILGGVTAPPALARNLNDAFTPSPRGADKRTAAVVMTTRQLAEESVLRLTLGYEPRNFAHRDAESQQIQSFCGRCFTDRKGGSLYLSGSPGCGKSALLRSLSKNIGKLSEECGNSANSVVAVHLNAMGMSDFGQLFCHLAESLTKKAFVDKEDAFEAIERHTNTSLKKSKTLLLTLDEIDALGKKASMEPDLCRLFELAHRPNHTFILVGIANQIDFTERHLASLRQQSPTVKPRVIVFKPYTFQTISEILKARLGGESDAARILNVNGIAFIARKVAAQSGDVRLALDICRRVLQQRLLHDSTGAGSGGSSGQESFAGPVSLTDIVKTIKAVMETKSKSNVCSLPRNLQMILFASTRLVAMHLSTATGSGSSAGDAAASSRSSNTLYQLDDLYGCYCDVCHDAGVFKPLSRSEFRLGLETLSSEGMIGTSELKKQLIKLLCTPSELLQTFKHDAYFSRLI